MSLRVVVYTCLIGGYEELHEQPIAARSDADFICFTDDRELTSSTWRIVPITAAFPSDPFRSQRAVKIRGHAELAPYDLALYIDNTVALVADPVPFVTEWLADSDVAFIGHDLHEQVIDEFNWLLRRHIDDPSRVYEQLMHYIENYSDVLSRKPSWGGMWARRLTPAAQGAMDIWMDHVLRYSRRDQASCTVAMSLSSARVKVMDFPMRDSPLHRWPTAVMRDSALNTAQPIIGPIPVELRRQQDEIKELRAQLLATTRQLRLTEQELHAKLSTKFWQTVMRGRLFQRAVTRPLGPDGNPIR